VRRRDAAALDLLDKRIRQAPGDPRLAWRETARPEQLLPPRTGDWRVFYLQGGRGSGKTRAGAQGLADLVLADPVPDGEYAIVAPTYADAWTKCVEGESGILKALGTSMSEIKDHKSKTVRSAWRTYGQVILHSGTVIYADSAAEGGLRIQGRNLRAAWCDEIGLWDKWDTTWNESLKYAVRQGVSVIIATGTPKASRPARALVRSLIRNEPAEGGVIVRKLRTIDNVANLSSAFYRSVVGAAKGTRLERQELEGELLDDVANALWTRDQLDAIQVPMVGQEGGPAYLHQAVIGVDPSDGMENSDEQAYTIAGMYQGRLYIVKNWGGQEPPAQFARRVLKEAVTWNARIIVEKNHGGEWLKTVFSQVIKVMRDEGKFPDGQAPGVEKVWAGKSKRTRAEPASALYERGVVRHCYDGQAYQIVDPETGARKWHRDIVKMAELEDQMATFTGASDERSPDRLDSLVWACWPFLNATFSDKPVTAGVRQWAASRELEAIGAGQEAQSRKRLRGAHGGQLDGADPFADLESFAPRDGDAAAMFGGDGITVIPDGDAPPERSQRAAVREWH
jgi:phage terminase large subunit-like protein